ncbi:MAG TPA: DNA mismatch repair protein MutS, partial [candidate division Zixibacteria bacterium]|nr:DNA mismatch repair protein MutS [candidate division Zixibacteria bacterium]
MKTPAKKKSSSGAGDGLTPLMRQFYAVKSQHPDKILFFRMGDFYEMFGEDAVKAAPILGITLTRRGQAGSADLPLAGVPHHSAEKYLARLLAAGKKVVIVEQVEDPKTAKAVVKREVVEILTPGSATLEALESPTTPMYLASVRPGENGRAGLAYLDLSTAEFRLFEAESVDVAEKLATLAPREALTPENAERERVEPLLERLGPGASVSRVDAYHFDIPTGAELLRRFFNVTSLEGFGVDENSGAVGA